MRWDANIDDPDCGGSVVPEARVVRRLLLEMPKPSAPGFTNSRTPSAARTAEPCFCLADIRAARV